METIEEKVYIYTLSCPITQQIRYVGKTKDIKHRYYRHMIECKNKRTHKECWIFSLKSKNLNPIVEILDNVIISEWKFWEIHYISLFKSWGFDLVNGTIGGEGMSSDYMKKNNPMHNPIHVAKMTGKNNPNYGKSPSESTRKKWSIIRKGVPSWNKGLVGKYYTEEMKIKFLYKPIMCHQNNKIYKSIKEAAADLSLRKEAISAVVRGDRKHHKNFTFEYIKK